MYLYTESCIINTTVHTHTHARTQLSINFTWRSLAVMDDVSDDISYTHGADNMCTMRCMDTFLIHVSLCSLVENSLPLPCLAYNSVLRCSQALSL